MVAVELARVSRGKTRHCDVDTNQTVQWHVQYLGGGKKIGHGRTKSQTQLRYTTALRKKEQIYVLRV